MLILGYILIFALLCSLGALSAAGLILALPDRLTRWLLPHLISYAIGTLLGAALLGMIPHALEQLAATQVSLSVLIGLLGFFVLESLVLWRHCHEPECPIHDASGPLILVGDAFHNFVDGLVIAAAFITSLPLGITVSLAVIAHEIPQEAGDFAILLHSGYGRRKAFLLNALSSSTTFIGALLAYVGMRVLDSIAPYFLCISAASFLYIALADLIPGRRGKKTLLALISELVLIIAGILTIGLLRAHP